MKSKLIWLLLLLFPVFTFLHPVPLISQNADKPALVISKSDSFANGLVAFTSVQEPKIDVTAYVTSGAATVEVYQTDMDHLLTYLVHDNKYKQLNPTVDVSKLSHLQDLSINLIASNNQNNYQTTTVSLPLSSNGIFFIRVKKDDLTAETYVIRSTFGSLAREAKDTLVVWSQDFTSKRSINGGTATLYNLESQKSIIGTANLDGDGIASLPLTSGDDVIVVETNGSQSIVPLNAQYLNGDYTWASFQPNTAERRYFLFTDRPIYKPGDTVRFKAIVRDDNDSRYTLPSGSVYVEVSQGYDQKTFIFKGNLPIDSRGFISTAFTIPKTAVTGDWMIALNPKTINSYWGDYYDTGDSIYFKVDNYRKPEYFLDVQSSQIEVIRGDGVAVNLSGAYYSGQPLSNVDVNYKIYADNNGYYDSEYYYPDNGNRYYRAWNSQVVDSGAVALDVKGKGKITLPTDKNDSQGKTQFFFLEFTYTDPTGNPSLTGINVLVRSGQYTLYRDEQAPYGGKTNQNISLPLTLKANLQGVSLAQNIDINIVRHWWQKVSDANSKYPQYKQVDDKIGDYTVKSDSSGKALFNFTPTLEGSYELVTKITDSRGNIITKSFYLWVNDQYGTYGYSGTQSGLRLATDKKSYQPGDTAVISLNSDTPDRDIFLGFERGYQDRYQVIHMTGNSSQTSVKITDHDQPNIFLAAKSFTADDLEGDIKDVSVNTDNKKVVYTITTDKTNYAPGDEVTVNVTAKDLQGNPIAGNFALWAVDKSVYALADKNYGDVFDAFWTERSDNTQSAHSLQGIYRIPAAEKGGCFLSDTAILMADGSQKLIENVKVGDSILTRLSPNLTKLVSTKVTAVHQTSASGYLIINGTLKVTDNHLLFINNRWQMARALQIGDELTGADGQAIKVTSLEYLRGTTSVYNLTTDVHHTFFADGVYVHNEKGGEPRDNFADTAYWNVSVNTDSSGRAQIKFKLPDNLTTWVITALGASSDTQVGQAFTEIKTGKDLVVRPVLPNILGENDTITVSALVNNYTDLESQSDVSLTTDAGQILDPLSQKLTIAPHDFGQVNWQIKVGNAALAKFKFAVSDNLHRTDSIVQNLNIRPIGYWQQSSDFKLGASQFVLDVPTVPFDAKISRLDFSFSSTVLGSLSSAMKYLVNYPYGCTEQTTSGLMPKLLVKKYPAVFSAVPFENQYQSIPDGLAKLQSLQNDSGAWPWWWHSNPDDPFVTAYVFRLLNMAKSLGFAVDDAMYAKAQKNLSDNFDTSDLPGKVVRAYGLSFSSDPKLYHPVTDNLDQLADDYLAMAVSDNLTAGIKDPNQNGLNILLSRIKTDGTSAHWTGGGLERFGSDEASTALAVQALVKSGSNVDLAAKAVNYLLQSRHHDYWQSTYATSQTILALVDFSQSQKDTQANFTYQLMSGSQVLTSGNFTGLQTQPVSFSLDTTKIKTSGPLTLQKTGDGQLYTTFTQKWWLKDANSPAISHGVTITKTLTNAKGEQYNFVPGDLVNVILEVKFADNPSGTHGYAVIEDHLPAGLVPVNSGLLNESSSTNSDYTYKEYLADGVIIPITYNNVSKTYSYQARVITPGTYYLPPAYFALMYSPDTYSRSASSVFTVDTAVRINPLISIKQSSLFKLNGIRLLALFGLLLFTLVSVIFLIIKHAKKKKNIQAPPSPPPAPNPPQSHL